MQISLVNFGGFKGAHLIDFKSKTLPNGEGKTTLINAYVFTLTGKTLNGFVPGRVDRHKGEMVSVTLHGFFGLPEIRRTLNESGTTLYVGGEVATQDDFVSVLKSRGYDLDFIVACANANVLTSNGLDTTSLRKILSKADVLDSEDYDAIKKEQTELRKKRKIAEQHALTTVVVPVANCEPLSEAEKVFATAFKKAKIIVNDGVVSSCPHCQRAYDDKSIEELSKTYDAAELAVKRDITEFTRIMLKMSDYTTELQEIEDAKRLLETATKARKDLVKYDAEINALNVELRDLDAESVKAHLPEYVDVITEIPQKNGKMKATCTLEYKGVALRSINHAKRIEICVSILDHARTKKGMLDVPIIVDNAEAVEHSFETYKNVILLKALKR